MSFNSCKFFLFIILCILFIFFEILLDSCEIFWIYHLFRRKESKRHKIMAKKQKNNSLKTTKKLNNCVFWLKCHLIWTFFNIGPYYYTFLISPIESNWLTPKIMIKKLNKKLRQIFWKFVQGNCQNYSMFYKIYFKNGNSKFNVRFHILITVVSSSNNNNNNRSMKMDEPPLSLSLYIYKKIFITELFVNNCLWSSIACIQSVLNGPNFRTLFVQRV